MPLPEYASGYLIGYVAVTYNQVSHQPDVQYSDVHQDREDAEREAEGMREETARTGGRQVHEVAALVQLEADDDA